MAEMDVIKLGGVKDVTAMFDAPDVSKASYSLFDIAGNPVVSDQPLAISDGDLSVSFVVDGEYNTLKDGVSKDMRRVVVKAVTDSGRVSESAQYYAVLASSELSVPGDSFITVMEAKLSAMDMYGSEAFLLLSDHIQRQVLMEATQRLKHMRYSLKRIYKITDDYKTRPQNILTANTLPFYLTANQSGEFIDFTELTDEQYQILPACFVSDMAKACLTEAVMIVSTGGAADARDEGLLSESIGETTNMYRSGRAATQALARKTWRIVARYTDNTIRIGRG